MRTSGEGAAMQYRKKLYADYSAAFGKTKEFRPDLQYPQFENMYRHLPPDRAVRVGDLGCGKCEWLAWMASKGFTNLAGIDVAASELEFGGGDSKPDFRLVESDVTAALKGMPGEFDLLHAKDIFEHFSKDEAVEFLEACHGALRPGGELWILTFNAQSPLSTATRYGDFTHDLAVTPSSLAQVQRAVGFDIVEISGMHACPPSLGGTVRKAVFKGVDLACRLVLQSRHGKGGLDADVDYWTALPDLFSRSTPATTQS